MMNLLIGSVSSSAVTGAGPVYPVARYFRILEVTHLDGSLHGFAELRFNGAIPTGGTISASTFYTASYTPDKVLDNNAGTFWATNFGADNGSWIKYDFGSDTEIQSLAIQAGNSLARAGYAPTVFDFQYSSNNSTWTTWERITTSAWGASNFRTFNLTPT
jgi:hypothetical protein